MATKPLSEAEQRRLVAEYHSLWEEEAVEQAEQRLAVFIRQAWHVVEPGEYSHNWHIDAIAEHLEAVTRGDILRLLINMPPRCMKSLSVGVMWPAWSWIDHPQTRWMFGSYDADLSIRDAVKTRDIIQSPWYQARWGDRFALKSDQNVKSRYDNDHGGFRLATSVAGGATGEGGDILVADDPLSAKQGESDASRDTAWTWWTRTMGSRLNNPKTGAKVVVMQRLHEQDIAGRILEQGDYVHLCLPNEYEPKVQIQVTPLGWSDPRSKDGELLWPDRIGPDQVKELKGPSGLGSYGYAGQYQQRPVPAEGGMFKRRWWRFWHYPGNPLPAVPIRLDDGSLHLCPCEPIPEEFDVELLSWDLTFKETKDSDYVSGGAWGKKGSRKYLRDRVHDRLDLPATIRAFLAMAARFPQATAKLVEDKANGPAVISTLKGSITGLIPVEPLGSKTARAAAGSPQIEGGDVYLPHPSIAPWVQAYIDQHAAFPKGAHDDDVDMTSQALNYLREDRWVAHDPVIHQVGQTHVIVGDGPDPDLARPMGDPGYSVLGGALVPFIAAQRRRFGR